MAIEYDEYGEEIDNEEPGENPQDQRTDAEWAALRREKKKNTDMQKAMDLMARERAFEKVGLDMNVPILAMFAKGYEGELTKDAIEAAARASGLVVSDSAPSADTAPADNPVSEEQRDLGAQQRINSANAGSNLNDMNPHQRAAIALTEAYESGGQGAMIAKAMELGMPIAVE